MTSRSKFLLGVLAVPALLALPAPNASATTFCVPSFSAACPNDGVNVAEADLEKAMGTNAGDGVADAIVLAPGTISENGAYEPSSGFKNPGTIEPAGTDALTVTGAGAGISIVTSAGTGNIYLLALGSAARAITLRNLTLRAPASFGDDAGAVVQFSTKDGLEDAEIVSLNPGTDGVVAGGPGNFARRVALRGEGAGSIFFGFAAGDGGAGLTVEDALIEGASWPLYTGASNAELTARRVREVDSQTYGAIVTNGTLHVENSVFEIDDGVGLYASAAADDATLTADHLTIVNSGDATYPAMELKRFGPTAGAMSMTVTNSILRGFGKGYEIANVAGPGVGAATLTARYSNFQNTGTGNGVLDLATGNIDADPLFNADLTLPPISPSVDAGDPAIGGLEADFLGAPRPNDGNGDGKAVRDQGAFEYQLPVGPGGGGGGAGPDGGPGQPPDKVAPQTTIAKGPGGKLAQGKAKFSFRSSEAGSSFQCKLDRRKVSGCKSPKRYSGLKSGRHVFKVWATDAAGNKDPTPAIKRFSAPTPKLSAR